MNVTQITWSKVKAMPAGEVFGYRELSNYARSPAAVIKAVNRMVAEGKLERLSKGKFYVARKGLLGLGKPSDSELIRSVLYKDGRLRGYITGLALFNRLGITTQVPRTITIALNGARQEKDFGTIRIKTVTARFPIRAKDVKLLQYLDVLRDVKRIPDSEINQSLKIMKRKVGELGIRECERLAWLATNHYSAQARALLGLLYATLEIPLSDRLKRALNPTTVYKLELDSREWPLARDWNIQ